MRNARRLLLLMFFLFCIWQVVSEELQPSGTGSREAAGATGLSFQTGWSFAGYREETLLNKNKTLNAFTFIFTGIVENDVFLRSHNSGIFRGKTAMTSFPLDERELDPDLLGQYFSYFQSEETYTGFFYEFAQSYRLWGSQTFPGYLGGAARLDIYAIETLNNILYLNFTGVTSLNLHVVQKWHINEVNTLILSLTLPVFGYALRPSYAGLSSWPLESGFVSFHNYLAVFGDLTYKYRFNSLVSFCAGLGFEFSRIDFPRPRRDAVFRLSAGAAFDL